VIFPDPELKVVSPDKVIGPVNEIFPLVVDILVPKTREEALAVNEVVRGVAEPLPPVIVITPDALSPTRFKP
jgi:hypothetical protein